jgi:plasmid stability protein
MKAKKIQPLNLEKEVVDLLKARAEDNDRSMSAEANRILKKELNKK